MTKNMSVQYKVSPRFKSERKNVFNFFFTLPEYRGRTEEYIVEDLVLDGYLRKNSELTENGFTREFEQKVLRDEKDPENTSSGPYTPDEFMAEMRSWMK